MSIRRTVLAAFVVALALTAPALAIPVTGDFAIGGSSAAVGATFLNFTCNASIAPGVCPAGSGNFNVTTPVTGSFVPVLGATGLIKSLNQVGQPVGQAFLLQNFITFNPASDIALDLTFIFTGVDPQAACGSAPSPGQTCTPAIPALVTPSNPLGLSPFNLQNVNGGGSSASFAVAGNARRISTGELTPFTGTFTAQFQVPYQMYLATLAAGGSIENSYSATFSATAAPVPEPSSLTLLLGGLMVAGGFIRRRLR